MYQGHILVLCMQLRPRVFEYLPPPFLARNAELMQHTCCLEFHTFLIFSHFSSFLWKNAPPTLEHAAKWKAPNGTQGVEGHSIFRILPGSPASKSGCKAGDVLISVDGVNVKHRVS